MSSSTPAAVHMPWGLHLLHEEPYNDATDSAVVVDIVAVHGLGAHPDHAWVRHENPHQGVEKEVRWLTELLPQTLRGHRPSIRARIFCFNYQSAWLGKNLTKTRLENIAVRLLDAIHHIKIEDGVGNGMSVRPLIFIGHSFGGLVIEQAVVRANSAGSAYEYLVNLIGGIILLGTPHQGSKSQRWGMILARMASLIEYGETVLMDEVDEKSMKVFDLVFEFVQIMIRTDLAKTGAVVCFCENCPTNYFERKFRLGRWIRDQTSAMVVEETSAVLPGLPYFVLDSDHLKLNKFVDAADGNYMSVSSNLARIVAQTPQLLRNRQRETTSIQETYFMVSRERVETFVGRESQLRDILSYFSVNQTKRPRSFILHALGGQGKSQIALEYCWRSRETYRGIFWISAGSEATAIQSYEKVAATLMGVSWKAPGDVEAVIRVVKDRLEHWNERWLLVFDNYDEPDKFPGVKRFIPAGGHGDILFTSRNRGLERLGKLLEIPPLTPEEGVSLLLKEFDIQDVERRKGTASNVVARLGGLALAIDQAAAYIKYREIRLDHLHEFLIIYEAQRQKVLSFIPRNFWEYGTMQVHGEVEQNKAISAFTTWEMSFKQLVSLDKQREAGIEHFLTLSAFFDPSQIGESLFQHHWNLGDLRPEWINIFITPADQLKNEIVSKTVALGNEDSGNWQRETWDSERFWDLLAASYRLSLLQNISNGESQRGAYFSLHPLIRDWLQLREGFKERTQYIQEAVNIIVSSIKSHENNRGTPEQQMLLVAHMDACLWSDAHFNTVRQCLFHDAASCNAGLWCASFYQHQGRYERSGNIRRLILNTQTKELGEEHPSTLTSMNNLANVLSDQGEYKQAEEMLQQTLRLRETVLGKEHPDTLTSMNNLATVFIDQGQYKQAEKIHRQELELCQKVLGKDHPSTLISMDNVANVLSRQGEHKQAEEINREALRLSEIVLGKEHLETLRSMNNLATILGNQGEYKQAEEIYQQVLKLRVMVLGKEHPSTLSSMNNLANMLGNQGEYKQAEEIHREVLRLRETVLGKEHPSALTSMDDLANMLGNQGEYKQAEEIHREVLKLRETVLGKEHPATLTSMNNLANMLGSQGEYKHAEEIHREVLRLRETVLGKEHPATLTSMNNLASALGDQGEYKQAEEMLQQTLRLRETVLGKEHPDTLTSMNDLATVLSDLGQYKQAEKIHQQELELCQKVLGKDHPSTLISMNNVANVLSRQGRDKEAEEIYRQASKLSEKVLGKEHPSTVISVNNLALVLSRQDKFEQAEDIHR